MFGELQLWIVLHTVHVDPEIAVALPRARLYKQAGEERTQSTFYLAWVVHGAAVAVPGLALFRGVRAVF